MDERVWTWDDVELLHMVPDGVDRVLDRRQKYYYSSTNRDHNMPKSNRSRWIEHGENLDME